MYLGDLPPLRARSLLLLAACSCMLVPGIFFAHHAVMTIQVFILASPCPRNKSAVDFCCPDCLGLSSVQYGLSMGVPAWVAIAVILAGGPVLDLLGLPIAALGFSVLALAGALLRALGPYFSSRNGHVFAALLGGNSLIEPAKYGALAITQFLAIRYYNPKWQALIISLAYSSATLGGVLGGFITPLLATFFGTRVAFWIMVCAAFTSVVAAVGLYAVFRCREDLALYEARRREKESSERKETSHEFLWRSIKAFKIEYWLILGAFSLTTGAIFTYVNNVPLIHRVLFGLSSIIAARYIAFGWIIQIAASPLFGFLLARFPCLLSAAFFSSCVAIASFLAALMPGGSPLASSLLTGVPYALLLMALSPIMERFVPVNAVGLASSIIHAMESATFGVLTAALGAVLNNKRKVWASRRTLQALVGVMIVQTALLVLLAFRLHCKCGSHSEEETQALNQKTSSSEDSAKEQETQRTNPEGEAMNEHRR